jgi:hypothetical protein
MNTFVSALAMPKHQDVMMDVDLFESISKEERSITYVPTETNDQNTSSVITFNGNNNFSKS